MIYRMGQLRLRKAELCQEWLETIAPAVVEGLESFFYRRKIMGFWHPCKVKAVKRKVVAELQGTR